MNGDPLTKEICPANEEISSYFDGESACPDRIAEHLSRCALCRAYLDTLIKMDLSIKHTVRRETGTDREISEKILRGVKESLHTGRKNIFVRRFPSPVLWRAACLFLIAGITGYFAWKEYRVESGRRLPESSSVAPSAGTPAVLSPAGSRPVQLSDLSSIRFSSDGTSVPLSSAQPYQSIPDYVRHVWRFSGDTAQRTFSVEKALLPILKETGLPESCMKKSDLGMEVSFKGEKIRAVRFVKACSAAGFSLLSPDQPQPEQSCFAGSADETILYRATFPDKESSDIE